MTGVEGIEMKLPILFGLMLMPVAAMAIDTSDCEQIGYARGDLTIENVCWQQSEQCEPSGWTADDCATARTECEARTASQNDAIEKNCVLMRCPVTDELREYKNADKTIGFPDGALAYSDGTPVVMDELAADEDNVYLFYRCKEKIMLGAPSWYAIGPRNEKLNMARIQD